MCTDCSGTDFAVIENWNTCLSCGLQAAYAPKYYTSYALPRAEFRRQYYSRAKRFTKVLRNMKSEVIASMFECILQMYSLLEFRWNMKVNKTRKYFFSQKMVLWFILKRLDIPLIVPVLKNKDRGELQIDAMDKLIPDWGRVFCDRLLTLLFGQRFLRSQEKWFWRRPSWLGKFPLYFCQISKNSARRCLVRIPPIYRPFSWTSSN